MRSLLGALNMWCRGASVVGGRAAGCRLPSALAMAATPSLLSSPTALTLPTGRRSSGGAGSPIPPAKLHSIDFNPDVSIDAATPVVIMHGMLGNSGNFRTWGANLTKEVKTARRMFALDLRNHGKSEHLPTMSYEEMADDVYNFLSLKGMADENKGAILVGHSMGGKVAAMTSLKYPDVIKGCVIMDICPVSYSVVDQTNWGESQKVVKALHAMDLSSISSRRDADSKLEKDVVDPMIRAFALTNLEQKSDGSFHWRINVNAITDSLSTLAQFVMPESLSRAQYSRDTFFVVGGKSRYFRSAYLPQIQKLFPNYTVKTIREAGHWLHADRPKETVEAIAEYLDMR